MKLKVQNINTIRKYLIRFFLLLSIISFPNFSFLNLSYAQRSTKVLENIGRAISKDDREMILDYLKNAEIEALENLPEDQRNSLKQKIKSTDKRKSLMQARKSSEGNTGEPFGSLEMNSNSSYNRNDATIDVLDLKNMEVTDVFKLISQKSGINIIASQNVKGKVTIYLKNMSVLESLAHIVDAYGWAYILEGDVVKVMTIKDYEEKYGYKFGESLETRVRQLTFANAKDILTLLDQIKTESGKVVADEKTGTIVMVDNPGTLEKMEVIIDQMDVPIKTEVIALNYANAEEVSTKLTEAVTPGVGAVKFDARSNKIVLSDTSTRLKELSKIVKEFDKKDKEVLIEAKILQIALDDEHKMGVDWEAIVSGYHDLNFVSNFDILSDTEKRGKVSIGTIENDDYSFLIEALDTVGTTDLLSSPRITAVNNKEAKILVGSTEPYVTSTTTTPSSGPTTTSESVNFIEVGVKLFVTPTIHNDGFITMKIKPEVSSVTGNVTTSSNNTIPIVETSEAETTVIVKDGVTIVIGGLIKEEKITSVKRVPVLHKIPVLGNTFKNESSSIRKTEIVIFLTPQIISGDLTSVGAISQSYYDNVDTTPWDWNSNF